MCILSEITLMDLSDCLAARYRKNEVQYCETVSVISAFLQQH